MSQPPRIGGRERFASAFARMIRQRPCSVRSGVAHRCGLLGHQRIDTTQIYASIRPTQLKRSVELLDAKASRMLSVETKTALRV